MKRNALRLALAGVMVAAVLSAAARTVVGLADMCMESGVPGVKPEYVAAVRAAGGVPLILAASKDRAEIAKSLDGLDLLILCGGEDVAPARYGAEASPSLGKVNERRDAWEFALLDEAKARRLPVLGICRGCQVINVHFGGTLWQDLPTEYEGGPNHRLEGEHEIVVEPGSRLAKEVGALRTSVNSRHHQAVRRLAKGFKVTARSGEGVVEAIESEEYPIIGVQFHPERLVGDRKEFLGLFRPARERVRVVAIPEYCTTNQMVMAKENLVQALGKAGFVSVVIAETPDDVRLEAALAGADAVVVGGGLGKLQDYPRRRDFEHRVIGVALRRGIPISGICHGSQVINTYFGGELQRTPKDATPKVVHRRLTPTPTVDNFHGATVEPGTLIARALGSGEVTINSSHSVRSAKMGKGLKVTARAADGVVEAFEHETLPVTGFQFHPERMTDDPRFVELLRLALTGR